MTPTLDLATQAAILGVKHGRDLRAAILALASQEIAEIVTTEQQAMERELWLRGSRG